MNRKSNPKQERKRKYSIQFKVAEIDPTKTTE